MLDPSTLTRFEFALQALIAWPRRAPCPHCGADDATTVARKFTVIRVQRCRKCGLSFTRPIYRGWFVKNFYDEVYAGEGSTTRMPTSDELAVLKATCFRGTDKDAHDRLSRIRALVGPERRRLLEIGSSWGYFLYQAAAHGFDPVGVELGSRRARFGRDALEVRIVDSIPNDGTYDVIYTSHVLEHFTDLRGVFDRLFARLAPGGHLFVEVPNFDLEARGRDVLSIIGAVHPLGFDREFFIRNLPRYGFVDVAVGARWEDLADRPCESSDGDSIVVHARKA